MLILAGFQWLYRSSGDEAAAVQEWVRNTNKGEIAVIFYILRMM
jgi:hypothetical protein